MSVCIAIKMNDQRQVVPRQGLTLYCHLLHYYNIIISVVAVLGRVGCPLITSVSFRNYVRRKQTLYLRAMS